MRTPGFLSTVLVMLSLTAPRTDAGPTPPLTPDIPAKFVAPAPVTDYERRDVMIAMRDGVKLHTVIAIPKGARRAPIMLSRTPYGVARRFDRASSGQLAAILSPAEQQLFGDGRYIRVYQDVRGKYGSEGDYVMTRPLRGPLNDSRTDHSTDAYDTIDWLVKNVRETNGRVGMIGGSYDGFTVLMALIHPHPALKVAVPVSPVVDLWRGDDWFHSGAFRQINFDYIFLQSTDHGEGKRPPHTGYDDYESFLRAGSAGDYARLKGLDQVPLWHKLSEHPAYDTYWQGQALDKLVAAEPLTVPTLLVASTWDQEDIYGAVHVYQALEARPHAHDGLFFAMGPWRHVGALSDGTALGPLKFDSDTAQAFRRDVLKPFLDSHLEDHAPAANIAPVNVFETGTNTWRRLPSWPVACASGCRAPLRPLFLQPDGRAGFSAPTSEGFDEYVSDPAKPVPYLPRPVRFSDGDLWGRWLLTDQHFTADRPDVVSWTTEPLTAQIRIAGSPEVNLFAATTGSDADWVVKLIDVYPDDVPGQPELAGYELPLGMDIFRGRYRDNLEHPTAIPSNTVQRYRFALPGVDHMFLPGHRIMVQIQSSWFPLYDRNPQTFVDNIFFAKPGDYRKATQRVYHQPGAATAIELPIAP